MGNVVAPACCVARRVSWYHDTVTTSSSMYEPFSSQVVQHRSTHEQHRCYLPVYSLIRERVCANGLLSILQLLDGGTIAEVSQHTGMLVAAECIVSYP
eukprot:5402578-Pleurochrysis_carterae.AAC.1